MREAYSFNQEEQDQLILLRDAYRDAADALTETGKGLNRDVIFPLLFLYRHYLELAIKACLAHWADPTHEHHLLDLFENLETICKQRGEVPNFTGYPDSTYNFLNSLSELDPKAVNFRYPNANFAEIRSQNGKEINIQANTIGTFLEDLENSISRLKTHA